MIHAIYSGPCNRCDAGISPGQLIQPVEDPFARPGSTLLWEHVTCPRPPEVCGRCFMTKAANGTCGCDD